MKKPYELMGDAKERKTEIVMKENKVEEEEPEDVEDMIDEEDKEEEEEENEAVDADMSLFEYQSHTEGEKETQPTTQKHFKNVVVPWNTKALFVCEFGGKGEGKALRGGKYKEKRRNLSNFLKVFFFREW